MATIIGYCETVYKKFTCYNCGAIVQYTNNEVRDTTRKDEGVTIKGLICPECGDFHRTNN
jgi:RNase P subunit RPR2